MSEPKRDVPQGTQEEAQSAKSLENVRFQFYCKPISNTTRKAEWTLKDVYNYITMDMQAMQNTLKLRSIEDAKQAKAYKANNLDYVCFSGLFDSRNDEGLKEHSGLLCIDFDHIGSDRLQELKERLVNDEFLESWLLFRSPSGDGLKWVIDIDLNIYTHEEWFTAISKYVEETYGLTADPQCRNVSRACFLPHDAECYAHPQILKMKGCVPF